MQCFAESRKEGRTLFKSRHLFVVRTSRQVALLVSETHVTLADIAAISDCSSVISALRVCSINVIIIISRHRLGFVTARARFQIKPGEEEGRNYAPSLFICRPEFPKSHSFQILLLNARTTTRSN